MARVFFILLLVFISFCSDAEAAATVRLKTVTTTEQSGQSQIVLEFNALPIYRVENSGQRIDLTLSGVTVSTDFQGQPESGRIIKVLYAQKSSELIVSILLRQPPARILTSTEDARRLALDLFWEAPPVRTAIAFQVPGLPVIQGDRGRLTVKSVSRYSGDWQRFFREFSTPLRFEMPRRFSRPPLPAGSAAEPKVKLYEECLAVATAGDIYQARILLREIAAQLDERDPLLPYCRLLEAEIGLAAGNFLETISLLDKTKWPWPAALESLRQIRLAAALAKAGKNEQAIELFRKVANLKKVLGDHPFSLESAATAFWVSGDAVTAASLYGSLVEVLDDPAQQALARFAWAAALVPGNERSLALESLKQLGSQFPAHEAGQRARMKLLDLEILSQGETKYPDALAGYGELSRGAVLKGLREEAAFKQALILSWTGQNERSIQYLQVLLRDFRGGVLQADAEALLSELLPPTIRALMSRGEDLQALVLVEKNRQRLLNGELGWPFLVELANAFGRLGFADRAARIYLFMLDSPRPDADKELLYRPFLGLLWSQQDYRQMTRYAEQFLRLYPKSKDRDGIFLWQLRALHESGRLPEAAGLLKSPNASWSREIELEAARLLTKAGEFQLLAELAGRRDGKWEAVDEAMLLQAEALQEVGQEARALPLLEQLMNGETFADRSAFRYAQIRLTQGRKNEAFKILSRLVETGKSPLWRRLAEETMLTAAN